MADGKKVQLTTPVFLAWDEENDVPDHPNAHGTAGWTERDIPLIYDRYDIWKLIRCHEGTFVNLTMNGRKNRISYRLVKLIRRSVWLN